MPKTLIAERYRLLEPLGHGGMGTVWLGIDEKLDRTVAVKQVRGPDGLSAADLHELRPRAVREARAAARLNHPNVVRVFDIVVTESTPWIVMEYLPSRSLYQVVTEDGALTPERAARIGLDVLAALRAAHGVGVLHRDVKPGNVLLTDDGRAVLTDFGIATIVGDPAVTRSGVVIGSPSFMAPERAADIAIGPPADLWSLGATLYFAMAGRSPYERSSMLATLAALASEDPPPLPQAGPLWPVLAGLLRRDPADRLDAAATERMLRAVATPPRPVARARPPVAARTPVPARTAVAPVPASRVPPVMTAPAPAAGRRSRWPVAVVVLALAVLLALARWLLPGAAGTPAAAPPGPSPATSLGAQPEPQPTTPVPTVTELTLPAGWHRYADPTGFSVAVPDGWTISRRGSIVYFSEPNGGRLLGIDQTDQPQPDPVADWAGKERYRVARGDFPDYQRVRLVAVDYFVKAADWEFTYLRDGVRLHVNNRGFITSPHQAYGMWWSTPDSQWAASLPDLRLIEASFRPVAA